MEKLINVKGTSDIKVINGIRRSGESELLNMFKKYVEDNDSNANIIYIDYNLSKLNEYVDFKYIQDKEIDFIAVKSDEKIYIQVSDDISNKNTFNRKVDSLLKI